MIAILNTSILTSFGSYSYEPITLAAAQALVKEDYLSAIGHASTAEILSELLGVEIPMNRVEYRQPISGTGADDGAIVFKLRGRPEEGKILNREEIESIGYDFGFLRRLS